MRSKSLFTLFLLITTSTAFAQSEEPQAHNFNFWFGLLEIPFLIFVITISFVVANSLKGGKFGAGMFLIAWGFLVMAIGHLHMQIEHITGYNIFENLLGHIGGTIAWFSALLVTWCLSALGFFKIYKASKI